MSLGTAGRFPHRQNGNIRFVGFTEPQRECSSAQKVYTQREIHTNPYVPPLTSRSPPKCRFEGRKHLLHLPPLRENTTDLASALPVIVRIPSIVTSTPPDETSSWFLPSSGGWLKRPGASPTRCSLAVIRKD